MPIPDPAAALLPGDIIQIISCDHKYFPALAIVSEIKSWGIQGYVHIVANDRSGGTFYIRLKNSEFQKCGTAIMITPDIDRDRKIAIQTLAEIKRDAGQ